MGATRRAVLAVLAGIVCLAPVHALASVRSSVLPNGAMLVVDERPATETVAIQILVGGGLLDEPEARRGLSTIHTRLLMRGTQTRSASEIARAADGMGARLDAWTGLRHEAIALELPAGASLEPALRLLAEVALQPRLDPSDLEKEKSILTSALASSLDDPSSFLDDGIAQALFPGHPFSRLVRLSDADVAGLALDDLRAWRGARLVATNVALVVVGRCDGRIVEALAADLLARLATAPPAPSRAAGPRFVPDMAASMAAGGGAPVGRLNLPLLVWAGSPDVPAETAETQHRSAPLPDHGLPGLGLSFPAPLPPPAPLPAEIRRRVRKRTTQPQISVALPIVGIPDEDAPALAILRHILGGFQERLSTEIREKRGFAYWVLLEGRFLPTAGWIGVRTGAKKKHLPEIEALIRSELARIVSEPPSPEEVDRARRYLTTGEARTDATNPSRAASLATVVVEARPLRTYEEKVARLDTVTPAQVQDLARRLFAGKPLAVLTLY